MTTADSTERSQARTKQRLYSVLLAMIAVWIFYADSPAAALEQVTLQLKWTHQFQFAGYYAARQQGYYRDAGLDVSIKPAVPGKDPALDVIDGKAQYGVGTSSLLLLRNAGKPVVALAVIFQHSPYILLSKQSSASQTIHNIVGKRLMLEPQADELVAYLKAEGIPLEKMQVSDHTFSIKDLIDGKVDVMSGYITDDPHELERAGFTFHAYTPRSAGIDFYGDNLFTTEDELKKHPDRVKAFREASLKGWQYALKHPDEIINLIVSTYTPQADRRHLKYEAEQIRQLMQPDMLEIGYMSTGRWQHIADIYSGLGMLPKNIDLKPFLFDPHPHKDFTLYYRFAAALLCLVLVIIATRLIKTSRNLKISEEQIRRQFNEIQQINENLENLVDIRTHELQQSRDEWIRTFDAIPDMIMVIDTEFRITHANRVAKDTLSGLSGEIIGCPCHTVIHGIDKPPDYCSHAMFSTDNKHLETEFFEPRLNRHCAVTITPLRDGDRFIGSIHVIRDITARKQLESVRDEVKNRLQKIASQVPGVIYQYLQRPDGSSCFPYASDAIKEIYQVSPEDVRESALKVYSVLHPDDFQEIASSIKKSAQNLTVWHHEYRVKFSDDTVRWLHGDAMPQREPDGSILWHGFISDITERKLAEEIIRSNEERLRLILKGSNDAQWDWNLESNSLYYSPNWWEMLGYRDNELPADPGLWKRLTHPDDTQQVSSFLGNVLEHGPDSYECEFRLHHKAGHYVPVLSRGFIQRNLSGIAVRVSGVNSNLTERKQIEESLRESQKTAEETAQIKSRFLAVVAHEFRTPLGLLTMSVEVLDRYHEILTPEELQENHEQICKSAQQIKALVDSVLLFSRDDNPMVSEVPVVIDIEERCRSIADDIVSVWGSGQTFTFDVSPECGKFLLAEVLFQRVIANLLTNAFRFTPEGGSISLSATPRKNRLVIEVTDTGIGIPAEDQKKIFEAFYRSSNVNARRGIGLGLSIVHEAVSRMNGTITVISSAGRGSTFRVELLQKDP